MAKMGDTGIGSGGNFVKAEALFQSQKVFVIEDAKYRPAQGEFGEQINVHLRYEEPDENDNETAILSLPLNEVRQMLINWFEEHPGESIDGVNEESGLILTKGRSNGKGNPPFIFVDASEADAPSVTPSGKAKNQQPERKNRAGKDDIPF